jgi:hypothetical protein
MPWRLHAGRGDRHCWFLNTRTSTRLVGAGAQKISCFHPNSSLRGVSMSIGSIGGDITGPVSWLATR